MSIKKEWKSISRLEKWSLGLLSAAVISGAVSLVGISKGLSSYYTLPVKKEIVEEDIIKYSKDMKVARRLFVGGFTGIFLLGIPGYFIGRKE